MRFDYLKKLAAIALCFGLASVCGAQNVPPTQTPDQKTADQPPAPPVPTALPTPAITGPLQGLPPAIFDAGPFGKIAVNGFLTGTR